MLKIRKVLIENVWNEKNFELEFDEHLNIILGQNGIGKSTSLEIISSCLNVDLEKMSNYIFSKIHIFFWDQEKNPRTKITLKKEVLVDEDDIYEYLVFTYNIFGEEVKIRGREGRFYLRRVEEEIDKIKKEIRKHISLENLGIERVSSEEKLYSETSRNKRKPDIDKKLDCLREKLEKYKLSLENECLNISKEFQKEVLEILMFNKDWDDENNKQINISINEIEKNLKAIYIEFGFTERESERKVDSFMKDMITDRKKMIKKNNFEVLRSLLYRINEVAIKLIQSRECKEMINSPLIKLIERLEYFIQDKKFEFSKNGEFIIYKNMKEIFIEELSSGEKQLLIIFIQVILQKEKDVIYILDEPEISLHIGWQKKLLESIRILNPNSQMIVATHSPEISAEWRRHRIHIEVNN